MTSLSFDGLSELYDETRVVNAACFDAGLDYLAARFPPARFRRVFEPGIGSGRIAVPLAHRGYEITGVDISEEMLAILEKRSKKEKQPLAISFAQGDVTKLPFADATFDLAIAVHLFYFIPDWRSAADETLRVVRKSGAVVLMHTGTGTEIPFLNERYKELCQEAGCPIKEAGVKSTREVVDYYVGRECRIEWIRRDWIWVAQLELKTAIDYLNRRAYSFTTAVPEEVHLNVIKRLKSELERQFGNLSAVFDVRNEIYLVVVERAISEMA